MDVLKNRSQANYDYISRYAKFPYFYHDLDNKYIYGMTRWLKDSTPYVIIKLTPDMTLDSLANKYYGRPDYFWIIADFNRITDPFINLYQTMKEIKIPTISLLEYEE